jgi:hypothetical protein
MQNLIKIPFLHPVRSSATSKIIGIRRIKLRKEVAKRKMPKAATRLAVKHENKTFVPFGSYQKTTSWQNQKLCQ